MAIRLGNRSTFGALGTPAVLGLLRTSTRPGGPGTGGDVELGASGGRTIYVEEDDEQRAREVLAAAEPPFSDEELAELSEAAVRDEDES